MRGMNRHFVRRNSGYGYKLFGLFWAVAGRCGPFFLPNHGQRGAITCTIVRVIESRLGQHRAESDRGSGHRASGLAAAAGYDLPFFHAHAHPPSRSIIKKIRTIALFVFTYAMFAC